MKKFNPSLIIPIFYIAGVTIAALFVLTFFGTESIIFAAGAVPIIILNLAAIFMIDLFDMDLKHNLIVYIGSVIVSLILVLVSVFVFNAFSYPILMYAVPIVNTIFMTLGFYFDKDKREHEVLVWFLLNPNIYYIIALIFLTLSFYL